ncbi:hypothetical protein [Actinoplanes teichomyceticus]|uniref:Subtilase family protein n=1 Tax=Actinoplanes teichomyceticus TaxID=1867 RepID=A0A561WIL5_ACTTI|nr:hypothetical protein [Actinoplanes teichomyceticus]TWG23712.1 hypothetical protein FHX34_102263 [Actinoplanes teichomyceticus]GIF11752.1 hypothetical protein Ate01nite_17840 [Actinoplanes teichomyceticus]
MLTARATAVLLAAALLTVAAPVRQPAAYAAGCATAGPVASTTAWPRSMLAIDAVAAFTRGGGVTVAVLATGVRADHRQFGGRVLPGGDVTGGAGAANTDCAGLGTGVAG